MDPAQRHSRTEEPWYRHAPPRPVPRPIEPSTALVAGSESLHGSNVVATEEV